MQNLDLDNKILIRDSLTNELIPLKKIVETVNQIISYHTHKSRTEKVIDENLRRLRNGETVRL